MSEESYVDKLRREHPVRWWIAWNSLRVEMAWAWLKDEPVWNFSEEEPFLETSRTRKRLEKPC